MQRLTHALDAVKATRSRKAKVEALSALLRTLSRDDLPFAARLILGRVLPQADERELGVGWALINGAAAAASGLSVGVIAAKAREVGDLGDALELLLPLPPERGSTHLALHELPPVLERIAASSDRGEKQALLASLLKRAAPWEARYLVKAILGELRVGVQLGLFEDALAHAFGASLEALRRASALTPDPGVLALLAHDGRLEHAELSPGCVVAFMLATPTETVKEPIDPARTVIEDKLDGVRAQAHVWSGQVRLFARGQDDVTAQFPEVVEALLTLTRPAVLDGEIIAVRPDGGARPFQALQARLNRGDATAVVRASTPVAFVAYDCLFDGETLLEKPWRERRAHLDALGLRANPFTAFDTTRDVQEQLDAAFTQARARGNEGLMLKQIDAPYDAGRRGSAWRKVKRAFATLDVVVTRAERGHGKRAGALSDYTFAVWRGAELQELGKAYSGLTDAEIDGLTTRFEELTQRIERGVHVVTPEVVLEIAFDGIQQSNRHACGYALRFPRIARVRDDKKATDADTVETVQKLFEAQTASGHREPQKQLGLFEP